MEKSEEKEVINKEEKFIDELKNLQDRVDNLEKKIEELEERDKLEKKEFIKREANKKRYLKVFKIFFSIMLIFSIVLFVYKIQTKSTSYVVSSAQVEEYSSFIDSWNKQVKNITTNKRFLLSFSKNNENIEKLNSLLQNFYIAEITNSTQYNDFLEKNKFAKAIILNNRMREEELLDNLKEVTQETVISNIVKKILIMNSERIWEEHKNDK